MKEKNKVYLKLLVISIFMKTNLILPIRVLYMLQFNLSSSDISIMKAIFSLVVVLFELPTGIIADKISKKMSLAISSLLFSVHALFYIMMPDFLGFTLTQICLGLSSAFISGADVGYLHDYIEKYTKDEFIDVRGKNSLYASYFAATFSGVSSILFSINSKLNFIITCIFGILAFFIIYTLPENNKEIDKAVQIKTLQNMIKDYWKQAKRIIRYTVENKGLLKATILTAVNYSFLIFNFEYYQVVLSKHNFPSSLYGLLYASFMILMGYGARLTKCISNKLSIEKIFRLYMGLIGVSYILFSAHKHIVLILIGIIIQQLCFGSWELIITHIVLKEAPDLDTKSTLISLNSLIINLAKSIIIFIIGLLLIKFEYTTIYLLMAMTMWGIVVWGKLKIIK